MVWPEKDISVFVLYPLDSLSCLSVFFPNCLFQRFFCFAEASLLPGHVHPDLFRKVRNAAREDIGSIFTILDRSLFASIFEYFHVLWRLIEFILVFCCHFCSSMRSTAPVLPSPGYITVNVLRFTVPFYLPVAAVCFADDHWAKVQEKAGYLCTRPDGIDVIW